MLGMLPWSGFVLGFEADETITHLAAYLTQKWLSDAHELQMTNLLQCAVHWRKGAIQVEIEGPYFYSYLKSAFEAGELQYKDSTSFVCARSLGEALQSGCRTSIGFITNIHQNHWVATVINFFKQSILYGDSLRGQPDTDVIEVMQWWSQYHIGAQFATSKLTIPFQRDSFSCGILMFNALAHFYMPDEYPLMEVEWIDNKRMKMFIKIGNHHLNHATSSTPPGIEQSSTSDVGAGPEMVTAPPSARSSSPVQYSVSRNIDLLALPYALGKRPSLDAPSSPSMHRSPPMKVHVKLAISIALVNQVEGQSKGLMKWFMKGSPLDPQVDNKMVNGATDKGLMHYESMRQREAE